MYSKGDKITIEGNTHIADRRMSIYVRGEFLIYGNSSGGIYMGDITTFDVGIHGRGEFLLYSDIIRIMTKLLELDYDAYPLIQRYCMGLYPAFIYDVEPYHSPKWEKIK